MKITCALICVIISLAFAKAWPHHKKINLESVSENETDNLKQNLLNALKRATQRKSLSENNGHVQISKNTQKETKQYEVEKPSTLTCEQSNDKSGNVELRNYANNIDKCVEVTSDQVLKLKWEGAFDMQEKDYFECMDYVEIYEGYDKAANTGYFINQFCGKQTPEELEVHGPLIVIIHTDASTGGSGFKLTWEPVKAESEKKPEGKRNLASHNGQVVVSKSNSVVTKQLQVEKPSKLTCEQSNDKSGNVELRNYANNIDKCVEVTSDQTLKLKWEGAFDMQEKDYIECIDYVEIYEGYNKAANTGYFINQFCGKETPGEVEVQGPLIIIIHTDGSTGGSGFKLTWGPVKA